MKILVTGGCGFIGHHLVNHLISLGHDVEVWDNLSTGKAERISDEVNLVKIDIEKDELPDNHFDYVFHLASPTSVQESIEKPEKYESGCFDMTKKVFEWSLKHNVKGFTFSSTSAVYGDSQSIPLSEQEDTNPMSPYAKYKLYSEQFLKHNSFRMNGPISVMRFFNVFGEEQPSTGSYAPAVARFINQVENKTPITVTGDGLQTRDYIYVKDIVGALVLTINNPEYKYEIFNVGSGIEYVILDIAKYFKYEIQHIEKRDEPRRSCSNINKIKDILGWEPKMTIYNWLNKK